MEEEENKSSMYGSPQSVYKAYNNNFLPPASLKNKKKSSSIVQNNSKTTAPLRHSLTPDKCPNKDTKE